MDLDPDVILDKVCRRSPLVAAHIQAHWETWRAFVQRQLNAQKTSPDANEPIIPITTLRGRPPTTRTALLSHLKGLYISVKRGALPINAALHNRLETLRRIAHEMNQASTDVDGLDPQIQVEITKILQLNFGSVAKRPSPGTLRVKPKIPIEAQRAPSAVLAVFQLASEMGA